MELLTGKAPTKSTLNDEGLDLPRWVQSVVREEWTVEVFDVELMRYQNVEEEMVQMLHMLEDIHQFSDTGDEASRQQPESEKSDSAKDSQTDTPPYMQTPSE